MESSDIIDRLGGVQPVSILCGVSKAAVSAWRKDGIPPTRWATVVRYAEKRKIPGITWDVVQDARRASQKALRVANGKPPA